MTEKYQLIPVTVTVLFSYRKIPVFHYNGNRQSGRERAHRRNRHIGREHAHDYVSRLCEHKTFASNNAAIVRFFSVDVQIPATD